MEDKSNQNTTLTAIILGVIFIIGAFLLFGLLGDEESTGTSENQAATSNETEEVDANAVLADAVSYTSNGFEPNAIRVQAGDSVTWTNQLSRGAIVASDPHPQHTDVPGFESQTLEQGDTYRFTFDEPGTYTYHNHLSPGSRGTVVVE